MSSVAAAEPISDHRPETATDHLNNVLQGLEVDEPSQLSKEGLAGISDRIRKAIDGVERERFLHGQNALHLVRVEADLRRLREENHRLNALMRAPFPRATERIPQRHRIPSTQPGVPDQFTVTETLIVVMNDGSLWRLSINASDEKRIWERMTPIPETRAALIQERAAEVASPRRAD